MPAREPPEMFSKRFAKWSLLIRSGDLHDSTKCHVRLFVLLPIDTVTLNFFRHLFSVNMIFPPRMCPTWHIVIEKGRRGRWKIVANDFSNEHWVLLEISRGRIIGSVAASISFCVNNPARIILFNSTWQIFPELYRLRDPIRASDVYSSEGGEG